MSAAGDDRPIGVFDSGVGGLTVVRALMERLPLENIVYFGDTARVPYGVKSVATIEHFTAQIVDFLLRQEVKMLIVACNTMAAAALKTVTARAGDIPVIDVIEAGARAAAANAPGGRIGVIGTPATINSNAYARRIHALDPGARVYSQACPLFVPLVEEGWFDHPVTRLTAQEYLRPMLAEDIDSLVLG
ncbi:MAG: glutamate racemase, partial [Azoarcus sp.]|nr:glutamate racemase [Azoarcus sp.]